MVMKDTSMRPLPKERWTDSDKAASKFNSKSLTTIFSAVDLDQFKIIQDWESAKEAWDTLINHFEENTSGSWFNVEQRMCYTCNSVCEIPVQRHYERMMWRHLLEDNFFGDKQVKICCQRNIRRAKYYVKGYIIVTREIA